MGSCMISFKKSRTVTSFQDFSVYFLNYKENSICKFVTGFVCSEIRFQDLATVPRHAAFTYLFPFVYVVGGSDLGCALRTDFFRVNTEEVYLEYLPSLPMGSKLGDVYIHNDCLYYVGAVNIQDYNTVPTPFLRFSTDRWDVLIEGGKSKSLNILNYLFRPGTCLSGSTLFIIGGEVLKNKTEKTMNPFIFCLDLNTLVLTVLDFEGVKFGSPRCVHLNTGILVLGGYTDKGYNKEICILGDKKITVTENGIKVSGNKTIQKANNSFLLFSTKKLKKISEKKLRWKEIGLNYKDSLKIELKYVTGEKKIGEPPRRVSICAMYLDNEKSDLLNFRKDSKRNSPSNVFNSQFDFEYSATVQQTFKELSDINSLLE